MTRLFGTDGIRARAGEFPLNSAAIVAIGRAIGERLGGTIIVGQDTRLSSPWIYTLLEKGIGQTAASIQSAGVIPTPAVALLTKSSHFSGGVMISASHNPFDDNGIKVFSANGCKLKDDDEIAVEKRIAELLNGNLQKDEASAVPGVVITTSNATPWPEKYQEMLLSHFPSGGWLDGVHIVADCANGAMSAVAPSVLRKLGANVDVIHAAPSGRNINDRCGAVHLESLISEMSSRTADFGVAFDGDGDRSMFISAGGRVIDGDAVLLLLARRFKGRGQLNPSIVVGTQMTNFSLEKMLASEGIQLTRVAVGDRFIFEEMQRSGALLGGEPSGHIIFSDFKLSGDGLLTTLKVAQAIVEQHAAFDDLTRDWLPSPQLLKGVRVKQKVPLENMPALQAKLAEVTHELRDRGRIVVRYSGTEPLLRVMIESDNAAANDRWMTEILAVVQKELGAP
jgi:phosphoglucosamine mutase